MCICVRRTLFSFWTGSWRDMSLLIYCHKTVSLSSCSIHSYTTHILHKYIWKRNSIVPFICVSHDMTSWSLLKTSRCRSHPLNKNNDMMGKPTFFPLQWCVLCYSNTFFPGCRTIDGVSCKKSICLYVIVSSSYNLESKHFGGVNREILEFIKKILMLKNFL